MFSKKTVMIVGIIVLFTVNLIILSIASTRRTETGAGEIAIALIAPFQELVTDSIRFLKRMWNHYFFLVSAAKENEALNEALNRAIEKNNLLRETELSNLRLRNLLSFQQSESQKAIAAELIGRDPSPWFKSIIIDKGKADGLEKGSPVVIPEGIVGQVVDVSYHYSKVLLIIDQNSAVDGLVQRTRARGIIKGEPTGRCIFDYVMRKHEIRIGDTVVSSGLDGVFPKGLRIGHVTGVIRRNSGIFQEVTVSPFVDFETLEEVLVILIPSKQRVQNHP